MAKKKEKPGFVIYYDDFKIITDTLTDEGIGKLVRALAAYSNGEFEMPELDPMQTVFFRMLSPKLERDQQRYEKKAEENRIHGMYMAYCRRQTALGKDKIPETLWKEEYYKQLQATDSNQQQPTVTDSYITGTGTGTEYGAENETGDGKEKENESINGDGTGEGKGKGTRGKGKGEPAPKSKRNPDSSTWTQEERQEAINELVRQNERAERGL